MIKEERRRQRLRKKRRKRILVFLILFFLLSGGGYFLVTRVYTVEKVSVVGNELYTDAQIEQVVRSDEYSWSTLYVYLKYRFFNTSELPFVDSIAVGIDLRQPHRLTVEVTEKGILGYLYIDSINQNAYFDKDGFVVEISQEVIEDVPQIEGLTCDSVVLYEKLPLEDAAALKSLLSLTQLLEKYEIPANRIRYQEASGTMLVYSDSITVNVGSADNLTDKLMRLQYILPGLKGKKGTLHLENWSNENTDIIFEPQKSKKNKKSK